MGGTFAQATAIGALPVPIIAIASPHPVCPCFSDPDSRNLNRLRLISFRLARTRAYATPRTRSASTPISTTCRIDKHAIAIFVV